MFRRFAKLHDRLFTKTRVQRFEHVIVGAAFVGFFIHLGLIAVHKVSPIESPIWALTGESFLSALYTPFSFLLLYEVLGLILALPKSFSASLGAQFQIIALIFIRRIFGDIGRLGDELEWSWTNEELQALGADMLGALVVVLLTTLFLHASKRIGYERDIGEAERTTSFVDFKKTVALVLAGLFVVLGVWSLGRTLWELSQMLQASAELDLNVIFYKEMFTLMVLADVVVLLAAYYHTDSFEHVFRNAGFVVATVLLRIAFSAPRPVDVGIAATAILFAFLVYLLYGYAIAIGASELVDAVETPAVDGE
jgi:hypothetical protein